MPFATPYRQLLADARSDAERSARRWAPTWPARLWAWTRRDALERRLLERGADEVLGDALAVRAWQLTRPRALARIVRALEGVLADAEEPARTHGAAVPVRPAEVGIARDEILRVLERLRESRPVRPRGVVMLRRLLRDGNGPLYAPSENDELWRRVRRASIALG